MPDILTGKGIGAHFWLSFSPLPCIYATLQAHSLDPEAGHGGFHDVPFLSSPTLEQTAQNNGLFRPSAQHAQRLLLLLNLSAGALPANLNLYKQPPANHPVLFAHIFSPPSCLRQAGIFLIPPTVETPSQHTPTPQSKKHGTQPNTLVSARTEPNLRDGHNFLQAHRDHKWGPWS